MTTAGFPPEDADYAAGKNGVASFLKNQGSRQVVALGFAAFAGIVVGLLARFLDWGAIETYIVIGVAAAAVAGVATPFAFGPLDGSDQQRGHATKTDS